MSRAPTADAMVDGYRNRYSSGSYQGRFKSPNSVLRSEKILIGEIVSKSLEAREEVGEGQFTILDFAGGGGRLFYEYREEVLKLLKDRGLRSLKVICYDVTGLDAAYKKIFVENNFREILSEEKRGDDHRAVKTVGSYRNLAGDMEFKFVQGPAISRADNFADVAELVKAEVGMVDASLSIFGGISHIMGRDNRQKVLKLINEQTLGYCGVTLPSLNVHKEAVMAYAKVREIEGDLEEGDAQYRAEDGKAYPYHHYDSRRLREDFVAANFPQAAKFEIANIGHPLELHRSEMRDRMDSVVAGVASRMLSDAAQDKIVSYFQVLSPSAACYARQQTSGIISRRAGTEGGDTALLLIDESERGKGGCVVM